MAGTQNDDGGGDYMNNGRIIAKKSTNETVTITVITSLAVWLSQRLKDIGIEIQDDVMVIAITGLVSGLVRGVSSWWKHRIYK